jgi:hypothetical protein
MLHVRNLAASSTIVVLLASCSRNNSDSLPSLNPQAASTGANQSNVSVSAPRTSAFRFTTSTLSRIGTARSTKSVSMVGCPSSALCILQGQSATATGWYWYPLDGKSYPNSLTTTQFSQTQGVTYTINPNPVHNIPATYAVAFNVSLTAPIGIRNVTISGTSNDGSGVIPGSFSYYICSATTGSCLPCVPKPTKGANVLKEVPVLDKNGNPIIGAIGKPVVRPDDGQDFQFYASEALTASSIPEVSWTLDTTLNQLSNFGTGGLWDEQRVGSTNGQTTDRNFVDISTINIGVYGAIVGIPETLMQRIQEVYSATHNSLQSHELSAPGYPGLGLRNYQNMDIGYKLVQNGLITYNPWLFC